MAITLLRLHACQDYFCTCVAQLRLTGYTWVSDPAKCAPNTCASSGPLAKESIIRHLHRNLIAWLLATSPDASLRDGHEAVQLAEQANESTGWRDSDLIDTLAAAYAEIGDYEKAVAYQERACKMGGVGADRKKRQARALNFIKSKNRITSRRTTHFTNLNEL